MTRYATVRMPHGTRGARLESSGVVLLDEPDGATAAAAAQGGTRWTQGPAISLTDVSLDMPTVAPQKVICVGLNYREHIREMKRPIPSVPDLFAKFRAALIGPSDPILLPPESQMVDWEGELGIVIGSTTRRVSPESAREAIAGFTIVNDVSVRDWQWRTSQFLAGKTFEGTTPVGPCIVTPDEVDWAADLEIEVTLDGTVVQQARTSDMVFRPAEIVSFVSTIITLEPGDLICTGTPAGVGAGRMPPIYLREGMSISVKIEGIGRIDNVCIPDPGARTIVADGQSKLEDA